MGGKSNTGLGKRRRMFILGSPRVRRLAMAAAKQSGFAKCASVVSTGGSYCFVALFAVCLILVVVGQTLFAADMDNFIQDGNQISMGNNQQGYPWLWMRHNESLHNQPSVKVRRNVSSGRKPSMEKDFMADIEREMPKWMKAYNVATPKPAFYQYTAKEAPGQISIGKLGSDAVWKPVLGTKHKFYVYSAFFDAKEKSKPIVRIIAATKTRSPDRVWCKVTFRNQSSPSSSVEETEAVQAKISVIRENWNLKYSAVFVVCPVIPANLKPLSVVVISSPGQSVNPEDRIRVLESDSGGVGSKVIENGSLGVCVKPMHFNYDKVGELLEFLELNTLLGVEKFTLYNHTISPRVDCLLREYAKSGQVEVLDWSSLHMTSQKEIRTEGLFASLNDCLYRNMNRLNYLALVDFDEFIVPSKNDEDIVQMLQRLTNVKKLNEPRKKFPNSGSSKEIAVYSFQNAFFYLQFPNDPGSQIDGDLRVLRKTKRKFKMNPQKQRSKYICVPRMVKEAGNHFVWELTAGRTYNVPPNDGFMHHYRVCEFGGDDCVKTKYEEDRTLVNRYADKLRSNIRKVIRQIGGKCGFSTKDVFQT